MKALVFLSSTALLATAILGVNHSVYGQCPGGFCPVPNPYYDQNAPSKYGYDAPNRQGNQNPNWQGNQNPNYRNDRGYNNQSYQGGNNPYYQSNMTSYSETTPSQFPRNTMSPSINPNLPEQSTYFSGSNANQSYFSNTATTDNQNLNTDRLLQSRIEDALRNNYLKKNFSLVAIRVFNGNVTLSGSVESEDDRQDIAARVRAIQGVRGINDQLTIGFAGNVSESNRVYMDDTMSNTDTSANLDLQKQADDTLKNNFVRKNFDRVIVTVSSNGVVTVTGTVDSDRDRQEIRDRLLRIRGIKNINDRLQVAGSQGIQGSQTTFDSLPQSQPTYSK